ncbi:MAG: HAD family hydrolase [Clostridia bacterium]|nr:HAD family hydrolase [Clostridia bacterium]
MKNTLIFDLDGTLLNTLPTIAYYVNSALAKSNIGEIPLQDFCYYVGNGAKTLIRRSLAHFHIDDEATFERVYADYMEAYDKAPLYLTEVYSGIHELLESLKKRGIRCAVVTNKPHFAACEVVRHYFGSAFHYVQGIHEGVALKPNPDGVFKVLETLSVKKEDAFFVGDTNVDMQTGTNAGLETIGVTWGFRPREELEQNHATYIVDHPSEILDLLV